MDVILLENSDINSIIYEEIEKEGYVSVDTETTGLSTVRDRLCKIQLHYGNKPIIIDINIKADSSKYIILDKLFKNDKICKIFHFARMDLNFLIKFNFEVNNIFCTKIASKITRTYTDKHSLGVVCKELLGIDLQKQLSQSYFGININNAPKHLIDYMVSDVLYLKDIMDKLNNIAKLENKTEILKQTMLSLSTIVQLDIFGYDYIDIYSHKSSQNKKY